MKNELNVTKNNDGILLINALAYLLIFSVFMAVAVPKLFTVVNSAKAVATKAEMNNIRIAAMMKGPINNLNQLSPYFDGNGFKKDEFGVSYTFSNVTGKLCSTSINYCITVQ